MSNVLRRRYHHKEGREIGIGRAPVLNTKAQFLWIPVWAVYQCSNCQQNFGKSLLQNQKVLCSDTLRTDTTNPMRASAVYTESWSCLHILSDSSSTRGTSSKRECWLSSNAFPRYFSSRKFGNNENYIQVTQSCKAINEEARHHIFDLPEEILANIMEYLDVVDIIR